MADNANRRRNRPQDINAFIQSLHPTVRRTFLASGGSAYAGNTDAQVPEGWHAAAGGDMFQNAKRASDAAFQDQHNTDQFNRAAFRRDQPGRAYPPEMMTPQETTQRAAAETPLNSPARARSRQVIDAGTMATGHRVQIVGPNMVRLISPDGIGSSTFMTMARGKPIDAHSYLMAKPGFTPSEPYKAQRQQGIEAAMGMTKEAPPTVHPGAGGDYISQGGVENPVENATPAARLAVGAGTLRDTLTASPAAVAVRGAVGAGVDRLASLGRSISDGFNSPAAVEVANNVSTGQGAAGASRSQAARIQTPTIANPVPITDTAPQEVPTPIEQPPPPPIPLDEADRYSYGR